MHDEKLIEGIARAKFLMRTFAKANLKNASRLLSNGLDNEWPGSDYSKWKAISKEEKKIWIEDSIEWLNDLRDKRPIQYYILINNWRDIDE